MSPEIIAVIVAVLTFLVLLIVQTGTFIWKIAQARDVLREENQKECAAIRKECAADTDRMRREFGEIGIAIRQKIADFELYVRDHFVSEKDATGIEGRLTNDMADIADRIEARLLRMEAKIDKNSHSTK